MIATATSAVACDPSQFWSENFNECSSRVPHKAKKSKLFRDIRTKFLVKQTSTAIKKSPEMLTDEKAAKKWLMKELDWNWIIFFRKPKETAKHSNALFVRTFGRM